MFSLYADFSREDEKKKVYVQNLLREHAAELKDLVLRNNAHVYVCGDASQMAKDVFRAFSDIIRQDCDKEFGKDGDSFLGSMEVSGRWCEDVW
jgi:sulfite reductase alpha subunit-like flavoprotein